MILCAPLGISDVCICRAVALIICAAAQREEDSEAAVPRTTSVLEGDEVDRERLAPKSSMTAIPAT